MSRTYKYPRESLEDSIARNEVGVMLRMQKKLTEQKSKRRKKATLNRSLKKLISFRNKQRARI